jgi:hypothetical protein
MKMYKWYFEGQEIRFISSEEKLEKHVLTNRSRFSQPDAKIIIENEYFDSTATADAPCSSCGATTNPQSAVPVGNKKTKAKSEAVQLQPVSVDVPNDTAAPNDLGDEPDLDLLNGVGDRLAL